MSNGFTFSERSESNLRGVHPDLVAVTRRALELTEYDFVVIEGLRTSARQRELVAKGASRTMNSRHLTGHAIDFMALDRKGDGTWTFSYYETISKAFKEAAEELGVPITWGGDWTSLRDGPHIELERHAYPANGDTTPRAQAAKTARDIAGGAAGAGLSTGAVLEAVGVIQSPDAQQAQEQIASGAPVSMLIGAIVLAAIAFAAWRIMKKEA